MISPFFLFYLFDIFQRNDTPHNVTQQASASFHVYLHTIHGSWDRFNLAWRHKPPTNLVPILLGMPVSFSGGRWFFLANHIALGEYSYNQNVFGISIKTGPFTRHMYVFGTIPREICSKPSLHYFLIPTYVSGQVRRGRPAIPAGNYGRREDLRAWSPRTGYKSLFPGGFVESAGESLQEIVVPGG